MVVVLTESRGFGRSSRAPTSASEAQSKKTPIAGKEEQATRSRDAAARPDVEP